jgi:hypothetical protein
MHYQLMILGLAKLKQIERHARPHIPQSYKANVHLAPLNKVELVSKVGKYSKQVSK